MDKNQSIVLGLIVFLGLVLLAIGGYMYDSLQKGIAKEDESSNIFSGNIKLVKVFYISPFLFLYKAMKNRNFKGIILGIFFFLLLVFVFIVGNSSFMIGA